MGYFNNLAIEEQNKIMKFFCEKCEQEVEETEFTMDKDGEVCDACIQSYGDRLHDSWKDNEPESDMTGAGEGER